jgi:uncharacterized protein
MAVTYLDSSAIVKLAIQEPESLALRGYLRRRRPLVSSALARAEVLRALLPAGEEATARGRRALAAVDLVRINDHLLGAAGGLLPITLPTLDAIHLATAQQLGQDIRWLITYDDRMAESAEQLGIAVTSPT